MTAGSDLVFDHLSHNHRELRAVARVKLITKYFNFYSNSCSNSFEKHDGQSALSCYDINLKSCEILAILGK